MQNNVDHARFWKSGRAKKVIFLKHEKIKAFAKARGPATRCRHALRLATLMTSQWIDGRLRRCHITQSNMALVDIDTPGNGHCATNTELSVPTIENGHALACLCTMVMVHQSHHSIIFRTLFDLMMCSTLLCQMSAWDVFVANATWTWCWVQLPNVWGWTAPVSLVVTTVIVAVETHCQDREASACAFLSCAWCFSSQCIGFHHMWCTSPNHYIGIVCIIFWHAVQTCLWCTYPVWPRHTIHMRCGSWASIACNQSPVQGLWVVIADGEKRVPVHPCHVLDIFETLYRLPSVSYTHLRAHET